MCDLIRDKWRLGHVYLGRVEEHSAGYISGYVTKGLTKPCDALEGRVTEQARMSKFPGIGAAGMLAVHEELKRYQLHNQLDDVPVALRFGAKLMPLGRYLRGQLRKMDGGDGKAPKEVQLKRSKELLPVRVTSIITGKAQKEIILEMHAGAVANLLSKHRIHRPRKRRV